MQKRSIFIGIGMGVIIIASGWILFSDSIEQTLSQKEDRIDREDNKKKTVLLVINEGEGTPKNFEIEFEEKITPFDLLRNKTEELDMVLKTKTYDFGTLVEAIGGKENGEDGKNWMYYVNGEPPMVAADRIEIKPGDKIEFKFEKSPF